MKEPIRKMPPKKPAEKLSASRINQLLIVRNNENSKLTSIFVLGMWAVLALVLTNGYTNMTSTKGYLLWICCLAGVLAYVAYFAASRLREQKLPLDVGFVIRRMGVPEWGAVAFIAVCVISSLLSKYPDAVLVGADERFDGLITQFCYMFIFLLVSRYYEHQNWHDFVLGGAILVSFVVGTLQHYGINALGLFPEGYTPATVGFLGLFGNVNIVSTISSLISVFFGMMFVARDKGLYKWFAFAASVLLFFLQCLAGSDSGYVSLLTGVVVMLPFVVTSWKRVSDWLLLLAGFGFFGWIHFITQDVGASVHTYYGTIDALWLPLAIAALALAGVFLLISRKRELKKKKTAMLISIALIVVIILAAVLGIELLGRNENSRIMYQAREMLHGKIDDNFMSNRGYIWKSTIKLIPMNPLFGSGPDTLLQIRDETSGEESVRVIGYLVDKAHNEYLQYAVCEGLLGLAAYLTLLVGTCVRWGKSAVKSTINGNDDAAFVAAGVALIAYATQAIFNFSVPISAPFMFVLMGMAAHRKQQL